MSLDNSVPFKFFWIECSNNDYLESYKESWNTEKNHRAVGLQNYSSEVNNSIRSLPQVSFKANRRTLNKYRKYKFHF
jgi:hypothetical protein